MNYAQCRTNMVDSQIHTGGVVDEAVLEASRCVPRELFVHPGQEGIAYNDEDLPLGGGRYLMEPLIHARLMQAVLPRPADTVLDIGGATGYSAAIFSRLAGSVTALESASDLLAHAWDKWRALGARNITRAEGALPDGWPAGSPYSLIFLNGSVASIPRQLLGQLSVGGRLAAIVTPKGCSVGKATVVERVNETVFADKILFDAATPYLPGFEPRKEFVF